jgi:tetratricopeptide (TPR) repeat protein
MNGLTMHRTHFLSALAILTLSSTAAWAVPDGPMPSRNVEETSTDPKVIARNSYNKGHEAETAKARLRTARDNFRKAAEADPEMKEAWNMLGFTSRKLGDYNESLSAYEKALALSPDYPEAIEYRAELFLLTGRLAETKEAYAKLEKMDGAYAATLKSAIQDHLKSGKSFPASVSAKDQEDFTKWAATL